MLASVGLLSDILPTSPKHHAHETRTTTSGPSAAMNEPGIVCKGSNVPLGRNSAGLSVPSKAIDRRIF
jgi:hypothetical protein